MVEDDDGLLTIPDEFVARFTVGGVFYRYNLPGNARTKYHVRAAPPDDGIVVHRTWVARRQRWFYAATEVLDLWIEAEAGRLVFE